MAEKADDLRIREMRPGEAEDLVRLIIDVFEEVSIAKNTVDRFGPLNGHPWHVAKGDSARGDINTADVVLVGELDGQIVTMLTVHYDRKVSIAQIVHLAVAKSAQGAGIGRKMLHAALERARGDGIKYASIDALEQNPRAEGLYRSEGFAEVGRKIMMFRPL
ncbi:MAG: GNAT family N-acetyltransferase [Planctomycetota bacterium]